MMHPEDQRIMKMMEVLEQTGLFIQDELALFEAYLQGNAKKQELDKLPFRDLSNLPYDVMQKGVTVFGGLVGRGRFEDAQKLAHILFAAGESTCMKLLPLQVFSDKSYDFFSTEPEKRAALYAAKLGQPGNLLRWREMDNLIKMADSSPENIIKAAAYREDKLANGKLILLGAYFVVKYPAAGLGSMSGVRQESHEKFGKKEGILAGVGKLFGKKPDSSVFGNLLGEQDAALMKEYEDILVKNLSKIYMPQPAAPDWREIEDAINHDSVDGDIQKRVHLRYGSVMHWIYCLGGMGYINAGLSMRLKNVTKIFVGANTSTMLDAMQEFDVRGDMEKRGGEFDEIFGVEPRKYIKWAAQKGENKILKVQYRRNKESFLECMMETEFETYNNMASVLKEEDPGIYKERIKMGASIQKTRIINSLIEMVKTNARNDVRAYLEENAPIETLYPYGSELLEDRSWNAVRMLWSRLQNYQTGHGYDDFAGRCEALIMLCRGFATYLNVFAHNDVTEEAVKRLFLAADSVHLSLKYQMNGYSDIGALYCLGVDGKKVYEDAAKGIFLKYLTERREEMLAAIWEADSVGRCLGIKILSENPVENKAEILKFAQDTAKSVKEQLLDVLYLQKDWEDDITAMLSSKKAADRATAIRVLTKWDGEKYTPLLSLALEKEKNAKVRALLDSALHGEDGAQPGVGKGNLSQEDLVKEMHRGNKKRSLAWAYETPFPMVHRKNGEEASEEYLQAILLCYAAVSPCGISPGAQSLAKDIDEEEFAVYVNELFDRWLAAGAESKKRWVLYAAAIHGGSRIVEKMRHQIQEWPKVSRGAIASEAVRALALNPLPQALLIVDGISRKFKFKQVKAAAGAALAFAASQLGITKEELADRIVPDLGFDENMERYFDYGTRRFTVTITPALEVEVSDESGKKLKNLPSPGKRDDEVKAAAAYDEFKQMKKQMKATIGSQKMRLDLALSTERRWSVAAWKDLFVKNPIMHQFAIGLIWGVYEGSKLVACFRYMEDGSFNTEDEDEFELPKDSGADTTRQGAVSLIGLVHPIELTAESMEKWKQQMEDYEIVQPIEQLDRVVYHKTKEEEQLRSLDRFGGCIVNDLSLGGKLMGDGWYRGSVQDGGGFYTYYREDPELSLGVELHFSGSYVGGENEDVTVYEVRFYQAGTIKRGSYEYDEADDKNSYLLKDVPKRYFSEVVRQIVKAVSTSKDKNENWRQERR